MNRTHTPAQTLHKLPVRLIAVIMVLTTIFGLVPANAFAATPSYPVITQQPTDGIAPLNERYTVEVKAEGEGLKYQWYLRNPGAKSFTKSSVNIAVYSDIMTTSRANREVYCVITDAYGNSVTTNTVKLLVAEKLQIVTQPTDSKAPLGERYCVTVEAKGEGLKYTWYGKDKGASTWFKSSITTNTYTDVMTAQRAGREVYCVITDAYGNSVTSDTAKLIRVPAVSLAITKQPTDGKAKMGEKYLVQVEAQGEGLKYQWYYRNPGASAFTRSTITAKTYSDVMTAARANREVYCVISDSFGNSVTTNTVRLYPIETKVLRYDDYCDLTGKTVEILDAGAPFSYKVGTTTPDTAVVTLNGSTLIATGIGTAFVIIDSTLYEITVEPAPISLFMITGHSMGAGQNGNKDQSVAGPAGQVYSSHGTTNLGATTTGVGISYAAGTKATNVNAFTAAGTGTIGEGSALAWQWNNLTGEKVWVLNTAVGGSCLAEWIPGKTYYKNAVTQFQRAQAILANEIAAGHYTLSHMGILYHNGANFSSKSPDATQADYQTWYDAMWGGFKTDLSRDMDGNSTKETVSFLGLIPIWTKKAGVSYTYDEPAGLYMAASKDYPDIFTASVIGQDWVTDTGVSEKFPAITYTTQNGKTIARPTTASGVFSSDNVHYQQVGYNAVGIDIANNLFAWFQGKQTAPSLTLLTNDGREALPDTVELPCGESLLLSPVTDPITAGGLTFSTSGCIELRYPLQVAATAAGTGTLTVSCGETVLKTVSFTCIKKPTADPPTIPWEIGSIASASGKNSSNTTRLRTINYLSLADYTSVTVNPGYDLGVHAYKADKTYLGFTGWLGSGMGIDMDALQDKYPDAVCFRLVLRNVKNVAVTPEDAEKSGVAFTLPELKTETLSLRYDDHYDITGKTVEIIDAGKPISFQVGYGVEENKVLDTAVVTVEDNFLVATGIGTAKVKIDGILYEVKVETAPISLLLLIGQSNMQGSEGDANQSIVCPEGQVYSTYGDRYTMTIKNATNFAPSALTGAGSTLNVNGTTANLEDWPVYLLNEAGAGKAGPDSGYAYEWVQQTGEKVWVVNAAHGGTSINVWQPGTKEYEECQALFTACLETLRKEIAAGHFTLSHMGYFWCQGCSNYSMTAEEYVQKYLTMHESLKTELAFGSRTFEFAGIVPVRAGNANYTSYRQGIYTDTTKKKYHESFKDLRFTGPRVAQYWMINNPDLPDIWGVCNIGEDWVWMPDGTNGVSAYFQSNYENGTVDYTTQVQQSDSWYTPTTPAAVHDSIHYNQIGYNEVGRIAARNALILLEEIPDTQEKTSVRFLDWTGYQEVSSIAASPEAGSATLVVPVVYPLYRAKDVTYQFSDGLHYDFYDLTADKYQTTGTLAANGAQGSVTVEMGHLWSDWETVTAPSPAGSGEEKRTCADCGAVETKEIPGVWQTLKLSEHMAPMPESYCSNTNLWPLMEHDPYYFESGTNWGKHSSGKVYSVTIPIAGGDRIWATSFGPKSTNGGTGNGIRVTWFDAKGVLKSLTATQTYNEFTANGYLTAPEGAVAVNIPMWNNRDDNELYILTAEHDYESTVTAPTCTEQGYTTHTCACGNSYVDDYVDATGEHTYENGVCTGCGESQVQVKWEIGSIASANGKNSSNTTRLRTADHLVIADVDGVTVNTGFDLGVHVYKADKSYIGFSGWLGNGTGITMAQLLEKYPNAVYFRLVLRNVKNVAVTLADLEKSGVAFTRQELIHAQPENQGVANAIARAYSLTDVTWTPLKNVPGIKSENGVIKYQEFEAGKEYKGIPYSGVIGPETYVGLNVSLESFLTAVNNKNSVLYTENLYSSSTPKKAAYFGTVCSKFVQYALDVPGSFNTANIPNIPGMETIAMPGKYTVDQIKLGDVIVDTANHTTICTDIVYDTEGNVVSIEISEAVLPTCRRLYWTVEEFYTHFANYRLCRYAYIDKVPPAAPTTQGSYALMPRMGNQYNYIVSSSKAVVDVLESGWNKAVVLRDGQIIDEITLGGASTFSFDRSLPGKIEMYLVKEDGTRSSSVYAWVVSSSITVTDTSAALGGKLTVSYEGSSGVPLYAQVGSEQKRFCPLESTGNEATIQFTPLDGSTGRVRVAYQNEYGVYLSDWTSFTVNLNAGTGPNPCADPLISQGVFWEGYNLSTTSAVPKVQAGKENYWTYTMIPVEPNTEYYSLGATRMWFLDKDGFAISTTNAYKNDPSFFFTTPENCAFVNISYYLNFLEIGKESLVKTNIPEGKWEIGTIASASGKNSSSTTRLRTVEYLTIADYAEITLNSGYNMTNLVYDANYNYIGTTNWLGNGVGNTMKKLQKQFPNAVYFRIVLRTENSSKVTEADAAASGITFHHPEYAFLITQQPTNAFAPLGERYCVTVEAQGEGLTYQWYFRAAGTEEWTKSSVTDNTYDDVMTTARADQEVYCVITDAFGNSVTTDTVKLICTPSVESLAGKKVSILSHSASTYAGVSNDTNVNSTIGKNAVYYTAGRHGVYLEDTWWQQTIDALGMELLVNNSWSGSCVFQPRKGTASVGYGDRAINLHNDHTGEEPEVIFVYLGCNDFAYYKDTFGKADNVSYATLIRDNGDGTFTYSAPQTTCEAYAIMLHKVQNRYPNAEVYCMTSTARRETDYTGDNYPDAGQPTEYSAQLQKIATHFGCPVIDLEKAIPKEVAIFDQYIGDKRAHPNTLGMDQITNEVLSVMLGRTAEIRHVTSKDGIVEDQAVLLGGAYYAEVKLQEGQSVVVTMDGEDITAEVHDNGKISIKEVTGDITIHATAHRNPLNFRWEMQDDKLVSVGDAENALSQLAGTVTDGVLNDARYKLATSVVLKHDRPWELEWQFSGNWRGVVLSSDPAQKTKGMYYLSRTNGGQLCFGTWTGKQYDNYGVDLTYMDAQTHTYRLVNRVTADGSNMVWLYVDGVEIGPMNNYYVSSNSQNTTSDWISGKDFVFAYIGIEGHTLTNCEPDYLRIQECAHTYKDGVCTACGTEHPNRANYEGKVISILGDSASTFAGYIPVADGFNLGHRARYPQSNLLTDVNQTWWMQVITALGAKLGVNDSWAGSQVLNTLDTNSGDLGPDVAMASLTRIQNLGSNGTPDVILFYGAGNDIGRAVPLGEFNSATAPQTVDLTTTKWDTFADAYVAAILRLKHFYPDSAIVVMLYQYIPGYFTNAELDEYNSLIQSVCDYYNIPTIDLRNSGVTPDMLPDNIHPNAEGMDLITQTVLNALIADCTVTPGENVVYSISHELVNATASKHYYKGVSAGSAFLETITGKNVTITMGGVDVTVDCYSNGTITISEVTGDIVITAKGDFNADGHLQQLPDAVCSATNLWNALDPENIYYTVNGWGNVSAGTAWSITFPVQAGDQIWATSFGKSGENGDTANGVRITWFDENGVLATVDRNTVYKEFVANGHITAPEGALALNVTMASNNPNFEVYILNRDHCYENGTCAGCGDHIGPVITQQPENSEAKLGERYCVTVEANGEGLKYQWYFRAAGTEKWTKSSVTDNTYDDVMTKARANREVYCLITDAYGNQVTTNVVKLIQTP